MDYELGDLRGLGRATNANVLYVVRAAGEWQTRQEIAHALGLKVTPMLISILEGLVVDGGLVRARTYLANGSVRFSYACPEDLHEAS